jgi:hypothetical protein
MDDSVAGRAPRTGDEMPQAVTVWFREWTARLSQPSVVLLMDGDHVVVREEGELIASGFLTRGIRS